MYKTGERKIMPAYHTPSPSPSTSPSISHRPRSDHRPRQYHDDPDEKPESLVKTSLAFLGSVAVASLCAHRFWPKGFTYGDREDWEVREEMYHRSQQGHGHRRRGAGGGEKEKERHRAPAGRGGDRGARREGYRRRGGYRDLDEKGEAEPGPDEEPVVYKTRERSRGSRTREGSRSRNRDRDRDRHRSRGRSSDGGSSDRHSHRGRTGSVSSASRDTDRSDRSRAARKESRYYPPAPQRYAIERGGSRRSSWDGGGARSRNYYDDDDDREVVADREEAEPVYARRVKHAPRSRRSSVDDESGYGRRGRSRYSDDLYYGD